MRALGELVIHRASSGGFVSYMREFFGEGAAFVTGWLYWAAWTISGVTELSAVALYMQYYFPQLAAWLTFLIALCVIVATNLLSARAFGEFEFWAAVAKVGAIVGFLIVGTVFVVGRLNVGDHTAGLHNLWSNPGGFWPHTDGYQWYGPLLVMSGVIFAYASIELVGIAAGEMENAKREVPRAVNAVIFRIAVFYCGSILLLACMLPTSEYRAGTSPFVTVFDSIGWTWVAAVVQGILIIAAMSALNAGIYSTGRILRSLAMSKQAPQFTTRMSKGGVPYAGILMTAGVIVLGAVLNYFVPDAFELALEATAIFVVLTWASIFICQLRLRYLVNRGVVPGRGFQAPGYPWTSIIGLAFLAFVLFGIAYSGWQSSPDLAGKHTFWVVVAGIPALAALALLSWRLVRPRVIKHNHGRIKAVWSADGPTYPVVSPTADTTRAGAVDD